MTPIDVAVNVGEITLLSPDIDTRSGGEYSGGAKNSKPITEDDGAFQGVESAARPGDRTGIDFLSFGGIGQQPDVARIDLDLDFFTSLATSVRLGLSSSTGPCVAFDPTGQCRIRFPVLASVSADALDVD